MKLSIVVVNWNVKDLLKECLGSIFTFAPSTSFEICVVDNASADGSAAMVRADFPNVALITNAENRGFAYACNQAIRQSTGEYVLLLNPDCRLTQGAIDKTLQFLDSHPKAGIAGCHIINPDGSTQRSVRRFPTILSQLLMMFKVHHVLPNLPVFKKYFVADFDYSQTQEIDQPMGAAFLIRKKCLDEIGLLDERFFIWYEEVDLCKRAKDAGWEVWYDAESTVVHHGGQSFKQRDVVQKQINLFISCAHYLWKHFKWRSVVAVGFMRMYVLLLKTVRLKLFWSIAALELLSVAGYFFEPLNIFGFLFVVILTFVFSLKKLEYGLAIVFTELLIGSKGHLFSLGIGEHDIGARIGIFTALFLAWIVHCIKKAIHKKSDFCMLLRSSWAPWYGLVSLAVIFGIVSGIVQGNPLGMVYADANAWVFLLLALVAWDAVRSPDQLILFSKIAITASAVRIATILGMFYVMGHKGFGFDVIYSAYRWARTTGLAEITQFDFNVSRVFFQSQIYDAILLCVLASVLAWLIHSKKTFSRIDLMALALGVITSLILSFSRSYWIAVFISIPFITWLVASYYSWKAVAKTALLFSVITTTSLLLLVVVSRLPIPSTEGGFEFDLLAKRVSDLGDEAAAASRWNLLPVLIDTIRIEPLLGYGFGKTITYYSKDPRVLEGNPSGAFTTYAFEWGYLDIFIKLGFIGFALYLFFLGVILKRGWQRILSATDDMSRAISIGLWCGCIALLVTHIFSPYLNHPLGIGYLVAYSLFLDVANNA